MVKHIQGSSTSLRLTNLGNCKLMFWSARLLQLTKFPPVFCLYASLPRTSLLQGNASAGAKQLRQHFIFMVAGAQPVAYKPDCNAKPVSEVRVRT